MAFYYTQSFSDENKAFARCVKDLIRWTLRPQDRHVIFLYTYFFFTSQALRDGDKVWATLGTGTNQDGRTVTPITAPSGEQQKKLLHSVYNKFQVDVNQLDYIEAHGKLQNMMYLSPATVSFRCVTFLSLAQKSVRILKWGENK